ncbi:phosphoglycerate mutase [Aestuariicella hydrocarbonica]|uniref:Phosphoglycerate mutase n=1 Tax=Pseudomaricurvus hydrocarbonicus TaxID=1470433 RepID=A0A9E5T2W2_9GAMM|nr:histidine phosphatase family protein [Aestuariicella hydrocarbonica]NHO68221.1 phosphoglycerate mutase [Aestuariicella hydrocarbonica]
MKKLHLIRHAKSSWQEPNLADIDRPLSQRGVRACEVMAPEIVKAGCELETVYCSPASRATSTAQHLSQAVAADTVLRVDRTLYTFDGQRLLAWCRGLDDRLENSVTEVTIIGHNPALTDFCNFISDSELDNIPTCGYVQLWLDCARWQDLSSGSATLKAFLYPKQFK